MKEIINIAVLIATLFGGSKLITVFHDYMRVAALENVSRGLPPFRNKKSIYKENFSK